MSITINILKEKENEISFGLFKDSDIFGYVKIPLADSQLYFKTCDLGVNDPKNITKDFTDFLFKYCEDNKYKLISGSNIEFNYFNKLFIESGFKYNPDILQFTKDNDNMQSPYKNEYTCEPYLERGEKTFLNTLKQCSQGDPSYLNVEIENKYASEWKELDKQFWRLVFKDDKIIGVTLPFINFNYPNVGNIAYMGIVPDQRNINHGVKLHNITLDILFNDMNIEVYLGMTHKNNQYMIKIFTENACTKTDVIVFST